MEITDTEVDLHVVADGPDDAPPLVLLHGITSSHRTWTWLVDELSRSWRVLRPDFRGHGGSGRADSYPNSGYLDDATAVCRAAERPCVVLGHSLGGATAAALAQRDPGLVRAVLLEDPPLWSATAEADVELEGNALLDVFRLMRESIPRLQAEGIDAATLTDVLAGSPSASGALFSELLHRDAIEAMAAGMLDLDARVLDPVLDGTSRFAYEPEHGIPVPTLLITADPAAPDAVCRPRDAERLMATSAAARLEVVPGAGHLVHDELAHRDRFHELVTDFLAEVATA